LPELLTALLLIPTGIVSLELVKSLHKQEEPIGSLKGELNKTKLKIKPKKL